MGSSTTTYQTLLQTVFYDSEGYSSLQRTFALPPQTVAFTPPASTCTNIPRSILCNEVKTEDITRGVSCWADKFITSSAASFPEECFPTTYIDIQSPAGEDSGDSLTLGYPGTACISGWTTACTTSLTHGVPTGKYVQTWCCPPGGWGCLTVSYGPPWRDCTSLLQAPTEVWIRAAESGGKTNYGSYRKVSLSNPSVSGPLYVTHPVFPLYGKDLDFGTQSGGENGLSPGAIAGIVVGIVLGLLALLGGILFVVLRKRRQKRAECLSQSEATAREGNHNHQNVTYDSKHGVPGYGAEDREMVIMSPTPIELSSNTRAAEVEGSSRPVELAS